MPTTDHVRAPLRPLQGLSLPNPVPAAALSKPGSALNHLCSSFKSMFPRPHPGDIPGRSGQGLGGRPADGSGGQQAEEGLTSRGAQNSLSSCIQCGQGPASRHSLPSTPWSLCFCCGSHSSHGRNSFPSLITRRVPIHLGHLLPTSPPLWPSPKFKRRFPPFVISANVY